MEEIMVFGVVLKMRKNEMKMRFFFRVLFCFDSDPPPWLRSSSDGVYI
jgi:hypothetical protein